MTPHSWTPFCDRHFETHFLRKECLLHASILLDAVGIPIAAQNGAWLEFRVEPETDGTRIHQTAVFDPRGLGGQLYWYALYPAHCLVFGGMLRRLAARAEGGA